MLFVTTNPFVTGSVVTIDGGGDNRVNKTIKLLRNFALLAVSVSFIHSAIGQGAAHAELGKRMCSLCPMI
jgi:hypothetical protein